jgi:hypothetical protein
MAWDPTARKPATWEPIESSRDENGEAQGEILCAPWDTARRLAYENRVTSEAMTLDLDPNTKAPIRRVMMGGLRLLHVVLTVVDVRGFPEGFDPTSKDAWGTLDPDVFDEVVAIAERVQPRPSKAVAKPGDHKGPKVESGPEPDEDDEDEGDGDLPDPSRRPSTPAE